MTAEVLYAFFRFMILMGIVRLPALSDYWSKDSALRYGAVADKISRDRYLEIHGYLHFSDNSSQPLPGSSNYDKLGNVRHVIESMRNQFQAVYHTHREVSVDEAMIPFKGRSTLTQYMPKNQQRGE